MRRQVTLSRMHYARAPDVAVADSPVKVIQALARVRTQVAFDDEGRDDAGRSMRSLHARATFDL
jgi:hypothetical protein